MDKQGRLTKWEEWVIGESYAWKKGRFNTLNCPLKCIAVNSREGFVQFDSGGQDIIKQYNWQNRFVHVPNTRLKGG